MSGHVELLSQEEKLGLLEERTLSDLDSDSNGGAEAEGPRTLALECPRSFGRLRTGPSSKSPVSWDSIRESLHLIPWHSILLRVLIFLTPSFLQGRHGREQFWSPKLSATSYLDGMRGLAALIVFFCHYSYQCFIIGEGWGGGDANYNFLKLPFIRIFYQGPQAVCVFFVISGYALSCRPLKLARSRSWHDFAVTVSSLMFRRGLRLYLPTAISTFLIINLIYWGPYDWTRSFATNRYFIPLIVEPHAEPMSSYAAQVGDWLTHMYRFIHVFDFELRGGSTSYDVHLWTIPVEFRCSFFLFSLLIATARLRTAIRYTVVTAVLCYVYTQSRWDLFLFFSGMFLADWDHARGVHTPPAAHLPTDEKQHPTRRPTSRRILWALVSILALYLLCQPDGKGESTPGWRFLTSLIPEWWAVLPYRYWQSAGAVLFIFAVGHSRGWQRFFNTPPVQYLGKISYALYLMHTPAMHVAGFWWQNWVYSFIGVEGSRLGISFFIGTFFVVPSVIWWADVFWRAVDIPCVRFSKWFEQQCLAREE